MNIKLNIFNIAAADVGFGEKVYKLFTSSVFLDVRSIGNHKYFARFSISTSSSLHGDRTAILV